MSHKIKHPHRILSSQEVSRFSELKAICHNGLKTFWEVGTALIEIHETKLYLQAFDSFQAFCREEFKVGRQYAYRLMQATKMKLLSPIGDALTSEAQARALSAVPKEKRAEVLERASSNGQPTALRITEEASRSHPVIELDRTGYAVPERAMKYWTRGKDMQDLLDLISAARSAIRKESQDDRIFVELRLQEVVAILNDAYRQFALAVPYAVCPTCQGQAPDTCRLCSGRGVISRFRYDTCVPSDLKAVRDKATKKSA